MSTPENPSPNETEPTTVSPTSVEEYMETEPLFISPFDDPDNVALAAASPHISERSPYHALVNPSSEQLAAEQAAESQRKTFKGRAFGLGKKAVRSFVDAGPISGVGALYAGYTHKPVELISPEKIPAPKRTSEQIRQDFRDHYRAAALREQERIRIAHEMRRRAPTSSRDERPQDNQERSQSSRRTVLGRLLGR